MKDKNIDNLLDQLQNILNKTDKDLNGFEKELEKALTKPLNFKIEFANENGQGKRYIEGTKEALLFGLSDIVYTLYDKAGIDKETIKFCVDIGFEYKDKGVV